MSDQEGFKKEVASQQGGNISKQGGRRGGHTDEAAGGVMLGGGLPGLLRAWHAPGAHWGRRGDREPGGGLVWQDP